ncbi:helix-turn-helix domain-containing protein [Massilia sp. BKSP1R2A-1]|uniref:helix-turn-helix domain-containing protein n=1 Tax=Massilia sp. BKSP1R2A-1 TaxID=3422595 RepID=UPI003D32DAC8
MRNPSPTVVSSLQPIEYSFPGNNASRLMDRLRDLHYLRTDAELSRVLGINACTLSKIRSGKSPISAAVILRIHETYGLPVAELRAVLADG